MSSFACIFPIRRLSTKRRRGFRRHDMEPVESHPYWAATGAVTYRDPDGREVVFAPFIFGVNEPPGGTRRANTGAPLLDCPHWIARK